VASTLELPRIKVCGVRALADVASALSEGLGAVGIVDHEDSVRHVESREARALVSALPRGVLSVIVMTDATRRHADSMLLATGARAIQLGGRERPLEWRGFEFPLLRRVPVDDRAEKEIDAWRGVATGFVLDHPHAAGGAGWSVDLERARELARLVPCLLGGGLDAENVERAVAVVRPWGVDGNARLEVERGVKDAVRVHAFVRAAARALAAIHATP
jgi:phosphoribosylanthranilate isomerase